MGTVPIHSLVEEIELRMPVIRSVHVHHRSHLDGGTHLRPISSDVRMHARASPIRPGARNERRPAPPLIALEAVG